MLCINLSIYINLFFINQKHVSNSSIFLLFHWYNRNCITRMKLLLHKKCFAFLYGVTLHMKNLYGSTLKCEVPWMANRSIKQNKKAWNLISHETCNFTISEFHFHKTSIQVFETFFHFNYRFFQYTKWSYRIGSRYFNTEL